MGPITEKRKSDQLPVRTIRVRNHIVKSHPLLRLLSMGIDVTRKDIFNHVTQNHQATAPGVSQLWPTSTRVPSKRGNAGEGADSAEKSPRFPYQA